MKRIISMVLVLVLLILCAPVHTYAIVPGEDSAGSVSVLSQVILTN